MTQKLKRDLAKEIRKQEHKEINDVLRPSFNQRKELLMEADPDYRERELQLQLDRERARSAKPKKELFHSSGVSHTIMSIRNQLDREQDQVKGMLFLKQLDEEAKQRVVWE